MTGRVAEYVEVISANGQPLAYLVRAEVQPDRTTFLTPDDLPLQLGFVVYRAGDSIARHFHPPLVRTVVGTAEVVIVKRGRCEVDIYDESHEQMTTRVLGPGDVLLLVRGGHGFRMLEDTVLLEVKQGPYPGPSEKTRF